MLKSMKFKLHEERKQSINGREWKGGRANRLEYLLFSCQVADSFYPMDCSTPGFPAPHHLLEFAQVHVHWIVMPSNHLILCCPLLLSSIFPSIRVFSNLSVLRIRWPKYWCFSFSISPSNEYTGLISFKIDWFDLLAVWWTLKSLLQHHSLKASIFWHSAFFMIQLWHVYMSMEKLVVLTLWIFISEVMSLLFNILLGCQRLEYIAIEIYCWYLFSSVT